jgi:hypothetical protein
VVGLLDVLYAEGAGIPAGSPQVKEVAHRQQVLQEALEEPIIAEFLEEGDKLLHLPVEVQGNVLKLFLEEHGLYLLLQGVDPAEKGEEAVSSRPAIALQGDLHVLPPLFAGGD